MISQRKRRILLAEDDTDDASFFFTFLRKRTDIELLPSVTNGAEVLEYLDNITRTEELPDVIILDHNMPRLTGKETLSSIKANQQYRDITVAVYSTYVTPNLIDECLQLGAALVETKPITREEYNSLIDNILTKSGSGN